MSDIDSIAVGITSPIAAVEVRDAPPLAVTVILTRPELPQALGLIESAAATLTLDVSPLFSGPRVVEVDLGRPGVKGDKGDQGERGPQGGQGDSGGER